MHYRRLGNSGLRVSAVGLGTNNFGGRTDEPGAIRVIEQALESGVTTIDTADVYNLGRSEEIIGRAVKGRRHQIQLLTKVAMKMGDGPHDVGTSRKHIIEGCEASLRRLQTDYLDLYQIHRWDPTTPLEETLRALDDLVRAGKVLYVGCSTFTGWQIAQSLWIADKRGYAPFVSEQPHYNLFERSVEREVVPACQAFGLGIIPYYPLAAGLLTGKYQLGAPVPEGTRFAKMPQLQADLNEEKLGKVERLKEIAARDGRTVGQLAIAWLLAKPAVSTVIAGATRPEQVIENAGAADWALDAKVVAEIEAIVG